ncbi:MAG: DUF1178 family protein [Alphaproteobacteria bacterium]|nr:DUF1178 family protein [Alphaproteobacteria bacterium]
MIRYSLACVGEHGFEAWFSDSVAYDVQLDRGLLECPVCGSHDVRKQIMAPSVHTRGENAASSPEAVAARIAGEVRRKIASTHDYVGDRFADEARSMYYGETEHRAVWARSRPQPPANSTRRACRRCRCPGSSPRSRPRNPGN